MCLSSTHDCVCCVNILIRVFRNKNTFSFELKDPFQASEAEILLWIITLLTFLACFHVAKSCRNCSSVAVPRFWSQRNFCCRGFSLQMKINIWNYFKRDGKTRKHESPTQFSSVIDAAGLAGCRVVRLTPWRIYVKWLNSILPYESWRFHCVWCCSLQLSHPPVKKVVEAICLQCRRHSQSRALRWAGEDSERSPSPGLLSWWQTTKPLLLSPHIRMVTEALDPSHVEDHLHMEVRSLRYVVKPYGKFTKAPLLPFPTEGWW